MNPTTTTQKTTTTSSATRAAVWGAYLTALLTGADAATMDALRRAVEVVS